MHLDESPGSVSGGNNTDSVKTLNSQTEGVSAEACAANFQVSDNTSSTRTDSRPTKLQLSQPLSGDMAVLANVVRSVVQEEFAAMKRDIVTEVKDEIDDTRDQLHRDIINLQSEMLRMFQIHQVGERFTNESRHDKTCIQGFQPDRTLTLLCSHKRWL